MGYLDELLGAGESIVFETNQHWFVLFLRLVTEGILLALLIAAAAVAPAFGGEIVSLIRWGALALGAVVVFSAVIDYLRWSHERYIVTDRRVIQMRGVFNKEVLDSSLEKINDIQMRQSMFGRMFNYGDIEILTASEEGINRMEKIGGPLQFKKAMLDSRARYDSYLDRSPVHAYETTGSVETTLSQLAALHARGILNDAEFEAKKREVLSRI